MKLINHIYNEDKKLYEFIQKNTLIDEKNILIKVFSAIYDKDSLEKLLNLLKKSLPQSKIIGTTTSHEISSDGLHKDETIISFSIFENTIIDTYLVQGYQDSFITGQELINSLKNPNDTDIKMAFCFSNGIVENGEELLNGIHSINPKIIISGGMAGDYVSDGQTFIFTDEGIITDGAVLATLKNKDLKISTDYSFNWKGIGKRHLITKSVKNRVYTIDDMKTMDFYKYYLGEDVEDNLIEIAIGLPLVIERKNLNMGRGIVKVHKDGSISYAGNIEEGTKVRFGYGNTHLILEKSKEYVLELSKKPIEAIYIYSCVGRKRAFMSTSIDLEIERYNSIAPMTGFLTHGEFYHGNIPSCKSRLLNLTMTIMALSENSNKKEQEKLELPEANKELKKSIALNNLISRTSLELQELTSNLEKKVDEEMAKNEEKDRLLNITQAQAEVGYMLEMIAHQWRQPLNAISSIANVLHLKNEMNTLKEEDVGKLSDEILDLSSFASQTIEDFRALFEANQEFEYIEIKELIQKVTNILKSLFIKNNITIETNFLCEKCSNIYIPLGQTLQVLINVLKNAVDASLENSIENPKIIFHINKDKKYYIISIEDNAGGIKKELLEKIFQRRFSTKKKHGTGLGLEICKSIVEKKLKGKIKVSNKNDGAIFDIKIPIKES